MTQNIFLGIGSNKGDRLEYLKTAVSKMRADKCTRVEKTSPVYETEPYGLKEQNPFLNAVVQISSERTLTELHQWIKNLEIEIGRQEGPKWGPREIDIDLLFYNNTVFSSEKLTVPHKEVLLRDFVLLPLVEIAPEFEHPALKKKVSEISTTEMEKLILKKVAAEL